MRHPHRPDNSSSATIRILLWTFVVGLLPWCAIVATPPAWWTDHGVIDTSKSANDYAAANIGQVKFIASKAYAAMQGSLAGGAGEPVSNMVWAWSQSSTNRNDYAAIDLGQLKTIAKPFYDRLIAQGLATNYPWTGSTNAPNDYALANLGQVKQVFSFPIPPPAPTGVAFSIEGGSFFTQQNVAVTSTPGAVLHYTLDGSTPTESSPIVLDGHVLVKGSGTLKVVAINATGSSPVASATFAITGKVVAGTRFTLALRADGTILGWGANNIGQLGRGLSTPSGGLNPGTVVGLADVIDIAVGTSHALAVKSNGTVWAWGLNNFGQLGNGTTLNSNIPVQIPGLAGVKQVGAYGDASTVLLSDGTALFWGTSSRVARTPMPTSGIKEIALTFANTLVGLTSGGDVFSWNPGLASTDGGFAGTAVALLTGQNYVGVRLNDGSITSLINLNSNLEIPTDGVLSVSGSWLVNTDGTLWHGGADQTEVVSGITNAIAITSSGTHMAVTLADGSVLASGANESQEVSPDWALPAGVPRRYPQLSHVISASSWDHHLVATEEGFVWSWGNNAHGKLGYGADDQFITTITQVPGVANVKAVSAGLNHSLALRTDGTVLAWGLNDSGELGLGFQGGSDAVPPTQMLISEVVAIVAGGEFGGVSYMLKSNGEVWTCGSNYSGGLGQGDPVDPGLTVSTPIKIDGLSNIVAISSSAALDSDGVVWTWDYQQGTPTEVTYLPTTLAIANGGTRALGADGKVYAYSSTPIYFGGTFLRLFDCGLLGTGGTVWTPGTDYLAPAIQVTGLDHITTLSQGVSGTMTEDGLAIRDDGTLWQWTFAEHGDGLLMPHQDMPLMPVYGVNLLHPSPNLMLSGAGPTASLGSSTPLSVNVIPSAGGTIAKVEYFDRLTKIGEATTAPFTLNWTPTIYGDYSIHSVAIEESGATSFPSNSLPVTVLYDSENNGAGNGLPDWWEIKYFGHLNVPLGGDPDGDGFTNIQEYRLGFDPTVPNDPLPGGLPPADAPQSVQAGFNGLGQANVTWIPGTGNETGFTIQYSNDGGLTWIDARTVAGTRNYAIISGLDPSLSYTFRVLGSSGAVSSASDPTTSAHAEVVDPPTQFQVTDNHNGTVNFQWTAPAANQGSGYQVQRLTDTGWVSITPTVTSPVIWTVPHDVDPTTATYRTVTISVTGQPSLPTPPKNDDDSPNETIDTDHDNLTDAEEAEALTNPDRPDSDDDDYTDDVDGWAWQEKFSPPRLPKPSYAVIELGEGIPRFVNDQGDVILEGGTLTSPDHTWKAWHNGELKTVVNPGIIPMNIIGLNNQGNFVGATQGGIQGGDHAYLYNISDPATATDLHKLGNLYSSTVTGVAAIYSGNSLGQYFDILTQSPPGYPEVCVVGYSENSIFPSAINNSGRIVGTRSQSLQLFYLNWLHLDPGADYTQGIFPIFKEERTQGSSWELASGPTNLGEEAHGKYGSDESYLISPPYTIYPSGISDAGVVVCSATSEELESPLHGYYDGSFHELPSDETYLGISADNTITSTKAGKTILRVDKSRGKKLDGTPSAHPDYDKVEFEGLVGVPNKRMQAVQGDTIWQNGRPYDIPSLIANNGDVTEYEEAAYRKAKSYPANVSSNLSALAINATGQVVASGNSILDSLMHVYLLTKLDIKQVISDQIAGNDANRLPTAYYRLQPNNPMVMGTRSGTDAKLMVEVDAGTAIASRVRIGVREKGSAAIINSALALASPAKTPLSFTASNGSKAYEIVAGIDTDGDGVLSPSEVLMRFEKTPRTNEDGTPYVPLTDGGDPTFKWLDRIIVVTEADFLAARTIAEGYSTGSLANYYAPVGSSLLKAFATGSTSVPGCSASTPAPTPPNPLDASVRPSPQGLSHPLGAKWSTPGNTAMTHRIDIPSTSTLSANVVNSSGIKDMFSRAIAKAKGSFVPGGGIRSLTLSIDDSETNFADSDPRTDPHVALGKCRFLGTLEVRFHGVPGGFETDEVNFTGYTEDLYDFAYGAKKIEIPYIITIAEPKYCARTQAGYATLTSASGFPEAGKIFFTKCDISTGWLSFTKTFK